jgi:histidyl-tRNA synthetase
MRDLISEDSQKFNYIIETATKIAKNYGYEPIRTPLLEETALFKRSVGESSDIIGKEMYQFIDKGGNDISLRPEGTAGVVRAFIQSRLDRQQGRFRFFYSGAMFRYERPQKGRFREFFQFGVESFGESRVEEDFRVILMAKDILDALGIDYQLKLNSLGCSECMPKYRDDLIDNLESIKDSLCEDCQRRIATNPIRVLDCKNSNCQTLLKDSPKITDNLCPNCDKDFKKLQRLLDSANVEYEVDKSLVRGLDYYTKSAFEFVSDQAGAQSAVAGGGRYDRLVEFLGGRATPAVGFAIGVDRLMEICKLPEVKRDGFYIGALSLEAEDKILELATQLRKNGKITIEYSKKSLKAHLKGADKSNSRYALIVGEDELKAGKVWLKDLEESKESLISFDEVETLN